jgi:NDP-sugar pyrophosphorylase family protein
MILAAGFGTRLGSLSDERPKPLLPVADVPLIRYSLALLEGHGLTEVAINLHHRGSLIVDEVARDPGGMQVTWSREEEILGTGGGLKRMADWLTRGGTSPFLVLNGKLVVDVDLHALLEIHRRTGAVATMVVREVDDAERWGAIDLGEGLDEGGRVVGIIGERTDPRAAVRKSTMFTGVHVVSPSLIERLPAGNSCVIRQGYLPALRDGDRISAMLYDGYFQEHSTPARYLEGNFAVLRGEARLRHPPGELTGVDPSARVADGATLLPPYRIGPGAVVETGATVGPDAVVGRRARVHAGARVERSVLWPDAEATTALSGAIVTPRGTTSGSS